MNANEKKNKIARRAVIICMILITIEIIVGIVISHTMSFDFLNNENIVDIGTDMFCMLLTLLLLYSCYMDDMGDPSNRAMMRLIVIIGFAVFISMIDCFGSGHPELSTVTKLLVTLEYIYDDLIVLLFWQFIYANQSQNRRDKISNIASHVIMFASMGVTVANWFMEFFFYIDKSGNLVENEIVAYSDLSGIMVYIIILAFILRLKITRKEKLVLLSFEVLPIVATILTDLGPGFSVLYPSYLLAVVLIYINVYQGRKKKIIEQENLLTKQNMALMISQIQPHFLYNTLTTISNLCVKDPEQAEETTVMFSKYLRGNLDSLRISEPVPFPVEFDHIQIYVELEQRRFGDKLNVKYDIQDRNFTVPSLGLQPIVENSIKHGICKKTEPGTLIFSTKKTQDGHVVIIEDDGVGFDPAGPAPDDGRSHVGMENVRSRLERMCGATMEVTSSPGNGCRTVITFPDK